MFHFSNGRIHFRNAWWYFLVEVVEEESADVEKCLWHVGTEGLILEKQSQKRSNVKTRYKNPTSNNRFLRFFGIICQAVKFFAFQSKVGFDTAISNWTLSQ